MKQLTNPSRMVTAIAMAMKMPATTPESTSSGCTNNVPSDDELLPDGRTEAAIKMRQSTRMTSTPMVGQFAFKYSIALFDKYNVVDFSKYIEVYTEKACVTITAGPNFV